MHTPQGQPVHQSRHFNGILCCIRDVSVDDELMLAFIPERRAPSAFDPFARALAGSFWPQPKSWIPTVLGLWIALLLILPLSASAGQFVFGLDLDDSGAADCSAALSDQDSSQTFTGLDRWVEVIVDPTPPARVTGLTVLGCNEEAFSDGLLTSASEWPVAMGAGVEGSDVIEFQVPSTVLDGAQSIRLVVGSQQDGHEADAMLSTGPIVIEAPVSVPMLSLAVSLLLALILGGVTLPYLRRIPKSGLACLLVAFLALADQRAGAMIGLIIDGALTDWIGIPASASDPAGDSADPYGRGDLRSLAATLDGGSLFVRLDAAGIEDAPCPTPPVIANAADLSACSDTASGATCSLECAPGWQASQESLSCQYGSWDPSATCSPIVFEVNQDTSLSEDLAVARLELTSGTILTLDDGVALTVSELTLAPGSVLGGATADLSIALGETATLSGDARIVADQLSLSGGDWSLEDTASIAANLDADLASLTVCANCSITASGQGYPAAAGPGGATSMGLYRSGSGGGHGGAGGQGYNSTTPGGDPYAEALAPDNLGSGGGSGCANMGAGGAGGGSLRIQVAGTLALAGSLQANGANGTNCANQGQYGGGGGAGGSIWIDAGTLHAPVGNRIEAQGGHAGGSSGSHKGGGGGGGRIMITAVAVSGDADPTHWSTEGGNGRSNGSEGTLWFDHADDWTAYGANSLDAATAWNSLTLSSGSELSLEADSSLALTDLMMESGSHMVAGDDTSLSIDALTLEASASLEGSGLQISVGNTATLLGDAQIVADELTLSGGDWSLADTAAIEANLVADVTNLTVCADCAVTASGRGYTAGTGPGAPANATGTNRSGSGGGHGGAGSDGYNNPSPGGSPYGEAFMPDTKGSGGGSCWGGGTGATGGGSLRIQVSGTLALAGDLLANGAHGVSCANAYYGSGGGSGGSIWIDAGILTASAGNRIQARGGSSGGSQTSRRGGGGGGGRIMITAAAVSGDIDAADWSVEGGLGRSNTSAESGTFWFNREGHWTAYGANNLSAPAAWNSLTVPSGSTLSLETDSSLTLTDLVMDPGARIVAADNTSLSIDTLTLQAGAIIEGGLFQVSVTNRADLLGDARIVADELTLSGGDWSLQGTAAIEANLVAHVTSLTVCATCILTASGQGHAAATGPGAALSSGVNRSASGGGYGGAGGLGYNSASAGGSPYGEAFAPDAMGSGGGSGCAELGPGGAGGGSLRIQVTSTLSLAGSLLANGANGIHCASNAYYGGGGGSGGSIWIEASTLEAPVGHRIEARGGQAGGSQISARGGGGGGGRIMITTLAVSGEVDPAQWSVEGGSGRSDGSDGTLWFDHADDWTAYAKNSLNAPTVWNSLTLAAGSELSLEAGADLTVNQLVLEAGARLLPATSVSVTTDSLMMSSGTALEGSSFNLTVTNAATLSGDAEMVFEQLTLSGGDWSLQDSASIQANLEADVTSLGVCTHCVITASALGHGPSEGPGGVASEGNYRSGNGAGHGGAGGLGYNSTAAAGSAYGDALAPETLGSGGGGGCGNMGAGGAGGGSLRIQVSGTLSLAGSLLANGANGMNCANNAYYGGGGGAGGSIWLTTGVLDASEGHRIEANGGQAGGSHTARRGGGGGGGRVVIQATTTSSETPTDLWSVNGGSGLAAGDPGSARLEANSTVNILSL